MHASVQTDFIYGGLRAVWAPWVPMQIAVAPTCSQAKALAQRCSTQRGRTGRVSHCDAVVPAPGATPAAVVLNQVGQVGERLKTKKALPQMA